MVQRLRVVDRARHAGGLHRRLHPGAGGGILQQHGVDAPGALGAGSRPCGVCDAVAQRRLVPGGGAAAGDQLALQQRQLGQQDGGLDAVQPAVHAGAQHVVARLALAMRPQRAIQVGAVGIVGQDGAAIAVAAQGLGRVEAQRRGMPPGAEPPPVQRPAEGLRRVVQREHAVLLAEPLDRRPIRRQAVEVDADHGARPQPALLRHQLHPPHQVGQVDVEGARLHIDEDRRGAEHQRHLGRRGIGEGGQEDRVARADPLRHHGDLQGIGAGGDADRMLRAGEGGQRGLDRIDLRPLDETAMVEDAGDAGIDLGPDQAPAAPSCRRRRRGGGWWSCDASIPARGA